MRRSLRMVAVLALLATPLSVLASEPTPALAPGRRAESYQGTASLLKAKLRFSGSRVRSRALPTTNLSRTARCSLRCPEARWIVAGNPSGPARC